MATEVWFRNPNLYIRECVEILATNIVWDRGLLHKKGIDPLRHAELYFPSAVDFRLLLSGDQGTAELQRGRGKDHPVAVYPTWEYGAQTIQELEKMLARPVGQSRRACAVDLPPDERPVYGQEHRVMVVRLPELSTLRGRKAYLMMSELQAEYPDAILHVHGSYSFRYAFGLGFRSVDIEPRTKARLGGVFLPNGLGLSYEEAGADHENWVRLLGFTPKQLKVPRNRCMFNMRSAQWAGEHYDEEFNFYVTPVRVKSGNVRVPTKIFKPLQSTRRLTGGAKAMVGDKFLCDLCSLSPNCKSFRAGAVCSIPGSESSELAKLFSSRDPDRIIDGLGALLGKQGDRLQGAIEKEERGDELDPEIDKMITAAFSNGVKLAKLLDPKLAGGGTKVQIAVGAGATTAVAAGTPQEMIATLVANLEAEGVPRDQITTSLIARVLALPPGPDDVIDVDEI